MKRWVLGLFAVLFGLGLVVAAPWGAQATTGSSQPQAVTTGTITGKLTGVGNAGLSGAYVYAYDASGSYLSSTYTDVSGNYTITLNTGSVRLQFGATNYTTEYYNDKADLSSATPITVTAGASTTANATLTAGAKISGTVTDADNKALLNAMVSVYQGSNTWSSQNTYTDGNGAYTFTNLAAGSYKLRFEAPGATPWLPEYYNDKSTLDAATAVTASSGQTTTANAKLARGYQIKGTVTDDSGAAVPYISVYVTVPSQYGHSSVASAYTDANGKYTTSGVPAGSYKVSFDEYHNSSSAFGEWWNNKGSYDTADAVAVVSSDVTLDPVLERTGTITGKVTDPDGQAVQNWNVTASSRTTSFTKSASTSSDGTYTLNGLPADDYTVGFSTYNTTTLAKQWYSGSATAAGATKVTVTKAQTTANINAALTEAGSISGKVTGIDDKGLAGVSVYAQGDSYSNYRSTTTASDGSYSLTGLPDDDYTLTFTPAQGSDYLREYYDDVSSYSDATPVTVSGNAKVTNINAKLAKGIKFSGKVSSSTGPLSGAYVTLNSDYYSNNYFYSSTSTDASGNWSITAPQGSYYLQFSATGYVAEYWDNAVSSNAATKITVVSGDTKPGLDAVLDKGASISGKITAETGTLPSYSYVYASTGDRSYSGYVGNDGNYTVSSLPAGTYKLQFQASGFVTEWWDDKTDASSATPIVVTKGQDLTGKNAALSKGASVKGTVVDSAGQPLQSVNIYVSRTDIYDYKYGYTNADGTYEIGGLAPGSYKISYRRSGYLEQYYLDKNYNTADSITVIKDETKTLSKVTLHRYSTIAGVVKDSTGTPVSGVTVRAKGPSTRSTTTRPDGTYNLTNLVAGSYRVELKPPAGSQFARQWYDGKASEYGSTKVVLANDQDLILNPTLKKGGTISGTVRTSTNVVMSQVQVKAKDGKNVYTGSTAADGTYTLTGVQPGKYAVSFTGPDAYAPQWYNGEPMEEIADRVAIDYGTAATGIDAKLADSSIIMGTVKDSKGVAVSGADVIVYETNTGNWAAYTDTDASGFFRTRDLKPGKYDVYISGNSELNLLGQWYSGGTRQSDATQVTVAKSTPTTINVTLAKGSVVSGKVTGPGNTPLAGAYVSVWDANGAGNQAITKADGTYSIGGLPAGDYTAWVQPPYGQTPALLGQYYNGAYDYAQATKITVGSAATVSNINFALTVGGSISGKVTTADAATFDYGEVSLYTKDTDGSLEYEDEVSIRNDGTYTVGGLASGQYYLRAYVSGYGTQYWDAKDTAAQALPITVTAGGAVTGKNFTMKRLPSVSGKVTAADGKTLTNTYVYLFQRYTEDSDEYWYGSRSAPVGQDGSYTFTGVSQGQYKLQATDATRTYRTQYWQNKATLAAADAFTVGSSNVTGKDFVLPTGSKISGTVAFPAGIYAEAEVTLFDASGTEVDSDWVESEDGEQSFSFPGLQPGTYKLYFDGDGVASEWWQDKLTKDEATPIVVQAGKDVTGLVATMEQGAVIQGTVRDSNGTGMNAYVRAYDAVTGDVEAARRTDADGLYRLDGLEPGSYLISFDPKDSDYATQWFNGAAKRSSATTVSLGRTGTITADATVTSGAIVTGSITDELGKPLVAAPVTLQNSEGEESTVLSNVRGVYTFIGQDADMYWLRVHPPTARLDLLPEWYNNAATKDKATLLDLQVGKTTTANAQLQQGATVSGTVKGPDNKPAKGIGVDLFAVNGEKSLTAWTGTDGTYRSAALEPGTYTVRFKPGYYGGEGMVERWWNQQPTQAQSVPVSLTAKEQKTGINATLGSVGNAVAPDSPTDVVATAGDGTVTVKWKAPAKNGGLPITKYEVRGSPYAQCVTLGTTECTIEVDNDRAYTFRVLASTDAGQSDWSAASAPVTPVSVKPKTPTAVTATASVESASVTWVPGGGAAATGYTVTSWPDNRTCTTTSTTCVVSGLRAGVSYRFTVVASNALGSSAPSAVSNEVIPTAPPAGPGGGGTPPGDTGGGGGGAATGGGDTPPVVGGGGGGGAATGGGGTTTPAAPAAVQAPKVKVKGGKAVVSWKPAPGATSYQVRVRKGKKAGKWKTVSAASFKAKLKKGAYVVEIRAVGAGGVGPAKKVKLKVK